VGRVRERRRRRNSLGIQYHDDVGMHDYLTDPSILEREAGSLDVPGGAGLGIDVGIGSCSC